MGSGQLADIPRDLVSTLRWDVTTGWVSRDDVRAKLRLTIKRLPANLRLSVGRAAGRHRPGHPSGGDVRR